VPPANKQSERIATLEAVTKNLVSWQEKQNGAIQKLRDRIDRLFAMLVAGIIVIIANLVTTIVK